MADVNDSVFYEGFEPLDVSPKKPEDITFKRAGALLIAHEGHFIGSRPFVGGRGFYWLKPGDSKENLYPFEQVALLVGDVLHAAIVVTGEPEMVKSPIVPAPFDKWKVGGDVLPDNPHVKRSVREVA